MEDRPRSIGTWRSSGARPGLVLAAVAVVLYAVAMAYVECAVVVYLRRALELTTSAAFPLDREAPIGGLGWIEVGREAATIVMLASVGWLTGRSLVERFAWFAVAFGAWDIAYYGWLWVFSGWPGSPATWDLLFLIPAPWSGPVWAPVMTSLALIGFGLVAADRRRSGGSFRLGREVLALGVAGALLQLVAFLANAELVLAGHIPTDFPAPVFGLGIVLWIGAVVLAVRPIHRGAPRLV